MPTRHKPKKGLQNRYLLGADYKSAYSVEQEQRLVHDYGIGPGLPEELCERLDAAAGVFCSSISRPLVQRTAARTSARR